MYVEITEMTEFTDRLIKPAEVQEILGVAKDALIALERAGRLTPVRIGPFRKGNRAWRKYRLSDVVRLMEHES
jgi:hypothetical protein